MTYMTSPATDISRAIANANSNFMNAFQESNAERLARLYTEDSQLLPPGSTLVAGKEGVKAFWENVMGQGISRVELNTLELDQEGDTAIEIGRARLYSQSGDVLLEPKYLVVWKREDNQWKLHRDIWNSDS
jgi:uncharacterized protein (TIGR02246 family)